MKRICYLILALLLCLLPVSCAPGNEDKDRKHTFISFTDDSGRLLSLDEKPKKVAVLFSSYAEMVVLSGGKVDITVGEAVERGFAEQGALLVDEGAGKKINTELLVAYEPDFVIGSLDISEHNRTAKLMNEAGIPTALFRVESFEDYERVMKILCEIFGTEEHYKRNVQEVGKGIDKVLSEIPKGEQKKILFVRCASTAKATKAKTSDNNFVCLMLSQMNTYNIAENATVLLDGLSAEEIILGNPDYIFFSAMGDQEAARLYMTGVLETPLWQSLDAVKKGNYVFLDKELFQYKPNNRWDKAYSILAELLYGKE